MTKQHDIEQRLDRIFDKAALKLRMIQAAPTIAGRNVRLIFKAPASLTAYGSTTLDPDGIINIRIDPQLGDEADHILNIFLHELAHIRLGHTVLLKANNLHLAAPRTIRDHDPDYPEVDIAEKQAEAQVKLWLRYGRKHADPGDQLGIIEALEKYYKNQ